ncbi:condensation domain-containing protein [Kutzneria sp. CA-103260]|uniref:condensation domain-containing protein n=1 Tax=Kutzneria sp. CA-103260 TaxID=2802641 RepID=UPI001BA5160B|nr:condensation domain-containing protein [Kutzneria sp. CA-103260]QUQ71593.1 non-ribosomal peptide synthetase [Kutzneria sp. CA-103260]
MTAFSTSRWPLSAAQDGIFSAHQADSGGAAHNVAEYVDIAGPVDPDRFAAATRQAVAEAEALHMRFAVVGSHPCQDVVSVRPWRLETVYLSADADPVAAAFAWMRADLANAVNLFDGPLFRQALLVLGPDRFFWYHRSHRIALDRYGLFLLDRRVSELYNGVAGEPFDPLRPVVDEDAAYALSAGWRSDRRFWLDRFADAPVPVSLAEGTAPPSAGALRRTVSLPRTALEDWVEVAGRCHTSWSAVVIAAVAAYLRHVTGTSEVVLGLPRMCRRRTAALNVPCSTSNTMPLRVLTPPGASLAELAGDVAEEVKVCQPHERYRSDLLRQELHVPRLFGPVVDINPISYELSFNGHPAVATTLSSGPVEDLTITVHGGQAGAGPRIDFDANPALYSADDLTVHQQAFLDLLETAPAFA